MINGNANDFVEGLYYGDERFFIFNNKKYFVQGYFENEHPILVMYIIENDNNSDVWQFMSEDNKYPVSEFENAKIFNGKSFWEAEKDIEWVDC